MVYHMAELGSWPSIQQHGLLSTSALLDLFGVTGAARSKIESEWRPSCIPVARQSLGQAMIRDQKPMPPQILKRLLTDMTPKEWYELINRKTFFWADRTRLEWMLNAYRGRAHCVLVVQTRMLLDRHLNELWLSAINSGSTYRDHPRGKGTFKRVQDFSSRWVAEVAIDYGVPDISEITTKVYEWKAGNAPREIWARQSI